MGKVQHNSLTTTDLHVPGYQQDADPGAVGAGRFWVDTTLGTGLWDLKTRNATDDGWETISGAGSFWSAGLDQTGLTGDKTGTFDLTTEGTIGTYELNVGTVTSVLGSAYVWANDNGNPTTGEGLFVTDRNDQYGTWISPSNIDGIGVAQPTGLWDGTWHALYINYYSSGDVDICYGGGNINANAADFTTTGTGTFIKAITPLHDKGTTAYTSQYPPAQSTDYVKATTTFSVNYQPWFTTDPTEPLTGSHLNNQWLGGPSAVTNQRFHIDLGSAKTIKRIYYENAHSSGGTTNEGAKDFTFWGSNTESDFLDLTYANDGTWVQLTCDQTYLDQHIPFDVVSPKYIAVTNTTAYRYYAFKFANNWGNSSQMGVRRIELQTSGAGTPTLSVDPDARKLYGIDGSTVMFDYSEMGYAKFGNNIFQSSYIIGGETANDSLIIEGTAHPTKTTSYLLLQPSGGKVEIGGNISATYGPFGAKLNVCGNPVANPVINSSVGVSIAALEENGLYGLLIGVAGTGNSWLQSSRTDAATAYNILLNPVGGNIYLPVDNEILGFGAGTGGDGRISFTGSVFLIQADGVTASDYLQLRGGTNGIAFNIGATQQILLTDGILQPTASNDIDLGTSTWLFKDFWEIGRHYFRDTNIYVSSETDGHLDQTADTSIDFSISAFEQIVLTDGKLAPTTTNDIDLGDGTHVYKNLYVNNYYAGSTAGVDMASGTPKGVTISKGIVTAATSVTPISDGVHNIGSYDITTSGGIITDIQPVAP